MTSFQQGTHQPETILFLHIPKTAGTTMLSILEQRYSAEATFVFEKRATPPRDEQALRSQGEAFKRHLKLIRGHFSFGLHECLSQPSTYFTLLRNPIERIISHYYYVLRSPTHHLYEKVKHVSLSEYVSGGFTQEVVNGQTQLLAGKVAEIAEQDLLDKAKKNLDTYFTVVGTTERFDETLMLLKNAFGWSMPLYSRQNVTQNRPKINSISPDELAIIREHNLLDLELYQYANQKLDQQIQATPFFGLQLAQFKLKNFWHNR